MYDFSESGLREEEALSERDCRPCLMTGVSAQVCGECSGDKVSLAYLKEIHEAVAASVFATMIKDKEAVLTASDIVLVFEFVV